METILVEQLRKVHKVFLDSPVRSIAWLAVDIDPNTDGKCTTQEGKGWGRKSSHKLIKEVGNFMLNSGQIHKISEGYLHPPPQSS
jgi:hypothetical protein